MTTASTQQQDVCPPQQLIRAMTMADVAAVTALDAGNSSCWNRRQWQAELGRTGGFCYVGCQRQTHIPHSVCCGVRVIDEAEIYRIAVAPDQRRQGYASTLLTTLLNNLWLQGIRHCWLEVRESNRAARALYRQAGFHPSGRRKNYYRCPDEDAILMKRKSSPAPHLHPFDPAYIAPVCCAGSNEQI